MDMASLRVGTLLQHGGPQIPAINLDNLEPSDRQIEDDRSSVDEQHLY